jgi:hypothetical protein
MDLLAVVGAISYDGGVTDMELWALVGHELRRRRTERGHPSTISLATFIKDTHAQKTFDRVERGAVGQVKSVHKYCEAVGTTLAEVLRSVLPTPELSERAMQVALAYQRLPQVQPLVDLALQLPALSQGLEQPQGGRGGALPATSAGSRGRGRTGRHHQ